jgi:hypothetical protein
MKRIALAVCVAVFLFAVGLSAQTPAQPKSMEQELIKIEKDWAEAAAVTGRWTSKETFKGKDISGQSRWTDTFIKRDGRWLCVATHNSRIPLLSLFCNLFIINRLKIFLVYKMALVRHGNCADLGPVFLGFSLLLLEPVLVISRQQL